MKVDLSRVRELVSAVNQSRVTELTVRGPDGTITVRRAVAAPPAALNRHAETAPEAAPVAAGSEPEPVESRLAIKSPAVGYARLQVGKDANSRIAVGDLVNEGQVVCIIESMNVPTEVHTPKAGRVETIAVKAEHPVEWGQTLMWIEPT